jgi:hypothetical protein
MLRIELDLPLLPPDVLPAAPLFEVLLDTRLRLSAVMPPTAAIEDALLLRMKFGGTASSLVDTLRFIIPLPWVCVRDRFRGLVDEGEEGGFSAIPLVRTLLLLLLLDGAGGEKRDIA